LILKSLFLHLVKYNHRKFMANEINMYYRFTSNNEPKEEQLSFLMQEVSEEVRQKNSSLQSAIVENIQREYENIKKIYPNL